MATVIRNILGYLPHPPSVAPQTGDRSTSLEDIFNYLELDNRITTSGQPSATQLGLIKAAGYTTIINQRQRLRKTPLRMKRNSSAPGHPLFPPPRRLFKAYPEDFERFIETLEACNDERLWVHCAANMQCPPSSSVPNGTALLR